MGISLHCSGDFANTERLLQKSLGRNYISVLEEYGRQGVQNLSAASPVDTGLMASSWRYEVTQSGSAVSLTFHNDDIENGCNVAILVQYGHATKNGYFIEGLDFINPALRPIFQSLADRAWKEVTS